jgi:molybdenum cofactor biosynthesis protein B
VPSSAPVSEHRALSPHRVPCFVLVVSDSRKLETETSGKAIVELLENAGHAVVERALVRDEPAEVVAVLQRELSAGRARAIITTGGTGLARRDSTYEAVTGLFDKTISGFGELFRMLSYQEIGAAAMMSRATAGVAGPSAIFVLPGSEHAVRLAMSKLILPELGHIVQQRDK